jgi:hypothetical protein
MVAHFLSKLIVRCAIENKISRTIFENSKNLICRLPPVALARSTQTYVFEKGRSPRDMSRCSPPIEIDPTP